VKYNIQINYIHKISGELYLKYNIIITLFI